MVKATRKLIRFMVAGIILLFTALVFVQCSGPAGVIEAQLGGSREEMEEKDSSHIASKGNPKLGRSLGQLLEAYRQGGTTEAQAFAERHMMLIENDRVQVTIVTTEEAVGDVRDAVEAIGGKYQLRYKNRLQALVPIDALESLAQRPDVLVIHEPRRAVTQ